MIKNTHLQSLLITDPLHPTLELQILDGAEKKSSKAPALVDTGFDGFICLPLNLAQELNLEIVGETDVEVATGQNFSVQICVCRFTVLGLDLPRIEVEAIVSEDGEILIGTKYLQLFFDKFGINFDNSSLEFQIKK